MLWLRNQRTISAADPKVRGVLTPYQLTSWTHKCQGKEPAYQQAVKVSMNSVNQDETGDCWKLRCPLKKPAHKILFVANYPELQQREGAQSELKSYRERLGCVTSGRGWMDSHQCLC